MMKRLSIAACVCILLFSLVLAYGAEETLLRMRFEEGQVFNYLITQEQEISQVLMGMEVDTSMISEMGLTMKVIELIAEDQAVISSQYDYITLNMENPELQVSFDSRNPEEDELGISEFIPSFIGQEMRFSMTDSGKILDFKETIKVLQEAPFAEMFDFEKMMEQAWSFYPEEPLSVGDTWKMEMESEIPFPIIIDAVYQFTSQDEQFNHFSMYSDLLFNTGDAETPMAMEGMEITMDFEGNMQQNMKVDRSNGWLNQSESIMAVQGNMVISFDQGEETGKMEMPMSMTVKALMKLIP